MNIVTGGEGAAGRAEHRSKINSSWALKSWLSLPTPLAPPPSPRPRIWGILHTEVSQDQPELELHKQESSEGDGRWCWCGDGQKSRPAWPLPSAASENGMLEDGFTSIKRTLIFGTLRNKELLSFHLLFCFVTLGKRLISALKTAHLSLGV